MGSRRRPTGSGSIYRRKDGRYEAAVWVTTPAGQRRRKRVYGRTYEEAHEKYLDLLRQVQRGVPVATRSQRLEDYLKYWLEEVAKPNVRGTTYAKYEMFVRLYLVPGLGWKSLEKLTTADVRTFLNTQRESGQSLHKLQAMHAVLRNALQNAMREDLLTRNVAALVGAPQPAAREFTPWSVDDAVTFLSAATGHPLHAAFVLVITLGLRRGEVLGLGWDHVDLEAGTVRIRRQLQRVGGELRLGDVKTRRSGRVVPLPDLCVRAPETSQGRPGGGASCRWRRLGGQRPRVHYEARDADRASEHGPRLRPALREGGPAQDPPARHPSHVCLAAGGRRSPPANGHVDPGTQPDRGDHECLHPRDYRGAAHSRRPARRSSGPCAGTGGGRA